MFLALKRTLCFMLDPKCLCSTVDWVRVLSFFDERDCRKLRKKISKSNVDDMQRISDKRKLLHNEINFRRNDERKRMSSCRKLECCRYINTVYFTNVVARLSLLPLSERETFSENIFPIAEFFLLVVVENVHHFYSVCVIF